MSIAASDPAGLAGGLGQPGEGLDQRGVVGRERERVRAVIRLPRPQPPAVGAAQLAQQELAVGAGGVEPVRPARGRRRFGQRGEEQRVPLGEHLVVEPRADASLARVEQPGPGRVRRRPAGAGRRGAGCG